ncbi:MAG: hypothetical protein J6S13_07150 [Clostridia bacterium]|nr:hypothetical protein [Clostridia bacterium]
MTNTLKKILAMLLGVVLTVSLCSVAFAAISGGDAATLAALGISDGDSTKIVASPDGSGQKVILYDATGVRPNVELVNDWAAGTTYTVALKYWMAAEHTGGSFRFYYGKGAAVSGKTSSTSFSVDNSHIGDGEWHTVYVKFTYNVPSSNTANTKVYLTFYSGGRFKIYVKDIVIKAESFANMPGNFDVLKTDDGTALKNQTSFTYGSNGMLNQSTVGADGSVIFKPSSNGHWKLSSHKAGTKTLVQFTKIQNGEHGRVSLMPGNTYSVSIEYKAVALRSGTNDGGLILGYLEKDGVTEGYTGGGSAPVYYVDAIKWTSINEEYNTYNFTFTYNGVGNADLVIAIPFSGQSVAIKSTQVVRKTENAELISIVTYNDNGYITPVAGYVGSAITTKGSRGYLGEECKGWSSSPLLNDTVTTYPAVDATLYAKYNTVVIDNFNFKYGMRSGYDNYNASTASFNLGNSVKFNTTTVGFMIPAYDEVGNNDTTNGNYEWYKFTKGQKYSVALDVKDLTTGAKGNVLAVTAATAGGSGGKRSTSNQGYLYSVAANTNGVDTQFGATFTCKFADGYNNAIIRGTSEDATLTMDIERIIITKVLDDEPIAKLVAVSKRDASEKKTAGVRFKATVSQTTLANATEAGFVVVPADVLGGKTVQEYIEAGGVPAARCVNYNAAEGTNLIYGGYTSNYVDNGVASASASYDYQVVLTGLTSLSDDTFDLRGLDFTVAFFVTTAEGTVYHDTYTTSYNTIAAMQ